jgi:hypothetical protein
MKNSNPFDARRGLPPLDRPLSLPALATLIPLYGRGSARVQARRAAGAKI